MNEHLGIMVKLMVISFVMLSSRSSTRLQPKKKGSKRSKVTFTILKLRQKSSVA